MNESNWSKQYQEAKNKDRMAKTFSGKNDFESRGLYSATLVSKTGVNINTLTNM